MIKKSAKKHKQRAWIVGIVIFVLVLVGGYSYVNILPFMFPLQRHYDQITDAGTYDYGDTEAVFHGKKFTSSPPEITKPAQVLGSQDATIKKHIEVDLSRQKLYAFEDDPSTSDGPKKIAEFDVSTGKWGKTPTGTFKIWIKLKSTKMEGGSKALNTYYYLPNVPFTMFFYNEETPKTQGFGIHGAYWHSNFGEVMSHGCINMRNRDVEKLFYWATPDNGGKHTVHANVDNPGTEIIIYGESEEE